MNNFIMPVCESVAGLDTITNSITGLFKEVEGAGLKIVTAAIALGIVFLGGKFVWGKAKQWLSKV